MGKIAIFLIGMLCAGAALATESEQSQSTNSRDWRSLQQTMQVAQAGQGGAQMFLQCTQSCKAQESACEEKVRRNGYYPGADADLRRCVDALYSCNSVCDRYR